jgi:hypothetical protein
LIPIREERFAPLGKAVDTRYRAGEHMHRNLLRQLEERGFLRRYLISRA